MERRQSASSRLDLSQLRSQLGIEPDDLDGCLTAQPDLYYHVAEAFAEAVARRDAAKLDMEQAATELDKHFREQAVRDDVKVTETAISRQIAAAPRMMEHERTCLRLRAEADKWQALKEAYQQRSFMLRELVAIHISRIGNLSLERGVAGAHKDLAEANHRAAGEMRRARRNT